MVKNESIEEKNIIYQIILLTLEICNNGDLESVKCISEFSSIELIKLSKSKRKFILGKCRYRICWYTIKLLLSSWGGVNICIE